MEKITFTKATLFHYYPILFLPSHRPHLSTLILHSPFDTCHLCFSPSNLSNWFSPSHYVVAVAIPSFFAYPCRPILCGPLFSSVWDDTATPRPHPCPPSYFPSMIVFVIAGISWNVTWIKISTCLGILYHTICDVFLVICFRLVLAHKQYIHVLCIVC